MYVLLAFLRLKLGPDLEGSVGGRDGDDVGAPVTPAATAAAPCSVGDELGLGDSFAHGGGGRKASGGDVDLTRREQPTMVNPGRCVPRRHRSTKPSGGRVVRTGERLIDFPIVCFITCTRNGGWFRFSSW